MGRRSISRATMPQTSHFSRSELTQPLPQELIALLAALPDREAQVITAYEDEPPRKRRRPSDRYDNAITIATGNISLQRCCRVGYPAPSLRRLGVENFIKLQVDEIGEADQDVKTLIITTLPRSEYGKYKFEILVKDNSTMSPDMVSILHVLNRSRDVTRSDGALSVSIDIILERIQNQDHMMLDFQLKWSQSNSISNGLRNSAQRKLSEEVQNQIFPEATNLAGNDAGALSPQVFYESAFVTDATFPNLDPGFIPNLASRLFPFQCRALQWLLAKEGVKLIATANGGSYKLEESLAAYENDLPLSFREVRDTAGLPFYHSNLYHVVTRDVAPWRELESSLRGGILAEEMGLGKTVETISLILLHRRPAQPETVFDSFTNQRVRTTGATLIVTPETLKKQWVGEIAKHAPSLNVMIYEGRAKHGDTEEELIQQMFDNDVVVTTYNVLRTEVHFARPEPQRSRRHERTHSRASSPLVKLSWWRVCLDEAQQIESGVSAAAEVARLIPRVNAWGITGTPVKEKIKDLWGLLLFLRYEPFASYPAIWDGLVTTHQVLFKELFNRIALRHSKHAVRHELVLPPQKRFVITVPFTAVEEQNYRTRFKQEVEALGLDTTGMPLNPAEWDSDTPATIDQMRRALASLRQTVLHPQLGPEKTRVLGKVNSVLRTIDEVLDAMIEQTDGVIKTHQRAYLTAKLRRGQLLENSPRVREALAIWEEALQEIETVESECRNQLRIEVENVGGEAAQALSVLNHDSGLEDDTDEENIPPRVGEARRRLRSTLDLKHRAVFFVASAFFQIKSNEDWTRPESDEFTRLEKLEIDGYDRANQIRKEILQEVHVKASGFMAELAKKVQAQSFVEVPELQCHLRPGLQTRRHFEEYEQLMEMLNEQANMVDEWREHVIQLLLNPLVDQEEDEITGDEYENSTKIQDDLMVYTTILRAAISDRQDSLSGLVNERIKHEMKIYMQKAKQGEGASPEKFLELLKERDQIKPTGLHRSLRAIVANLRELTIKLQGDDEWASSVELQIVRDFQKLIQEETARQTKAVTDLERELNLFTSAMNARVEYYRQLQAVSDTVATWNRDENEDDAALMRGLLDEETRSAQKMEAAIGTQRYQIHLKNQGQDSGKKSCPICTDTYTVGILTPCTHEFCRDCIKTWVAAHHRCPLCKKPITMASCHEVVVREPKLKLRKPQEVETHPNQSQEKTSPQKLGAHGGIYATFGEDKLRDVNDAPLDGPTLPTKVNALIRHLLWLRKADAGAKSIIFSQFGAFLNILKRALDRHNIGSSSFATKDGITRFKEDPGVECFLMDGRAHASGLNLINANHVFLCEPLLNTALELQAIARVDRIGQKHETNVWLYLVEGTIEESIYNISTKRRLEHLAAATKGKGKGMPSPEISEDNLEVANSMELQQANLPKLMDKDARLGEVVDKSDLWGCLFGHVATETVKDMASSDSRYEDHTVRGFLAGQAADERRAAQARYQEKNETEEALAATSADQQAQSDEE